MSTTSHSSEQTLCTSNHGRLRWQMRGGQPDIPLDSVWHRAIGVTLHRPHGFSEVRFDRDSDTLLCRTEETIVTVLCANQESFSKAGD